MTHVCQISIGLYLFQTVTPYINQFKLRKGNETQINFNENLMKHTLKENNFFRIDKIMKCSTYFPNKFPVRNKINSD